MDPEGPLVLRSYIQPEFNTQTVGTEGVQINLPRKKDRIASGVFHTILLLAKHWVKFLGQTLMRSSLTKIQHINKKEIAAPATSHRHAESARAKALPRVHLCHLPCFNMIWHSRLHLPTTNIPSSLLAVLVLWCHPEKQNS